LYRSFVLKNSDKQQQLLHLPWEWVLCYTEDSEADFREVQRGVLKLELLDKTVKARDKRYKVVRHNGAGWTSLPRTWLRDRKAKDGDTVELWFSDNATRLYVILKKREDAVSRK
jgi:hypothetical protein